MKLEGAADSDSLAAPVPASLFDVGAALFIIYLRTQKCEEIFTSLKKEEAVAKLA
jgi:hypothetical protein